LLINTLPSPFAVDHMSSNLPPHLTDVTVSSHLGRKWLEASNSRSVADGSPVDQPTASGLPGQRESITDGKQETAQTETSQVFANGQPESATVFVTMPDVSASFGDAITEFGLSRIEGTSERETALSQASEERLNAIEAMTPPELVAISPTAETQNQQVDAPRDDLSEPPTEWTDKPPTKDVPRTDTNNPGKKSTADQAIDKLAHAIVERFPPGDPTVLLFVGSEPNRHIDQTCARVASALAKQGLGRILLLDSDTEEHELSNASGVSGQPGLTDVVNDSATWESTIYGRSVTGLDFLPSGTGVFRDSDSSDRLRQVVAEMKREYQFICIAAGDSRTPSARIWNDICDGSYLLVSMKNSNQTIAKSAVTEMQSSGARLLGCVVTDVD
jgi:Mrp family chromosome partitioning ATPase